MTNQTCACKRCKRLLTSPKAIKLGMGAKCYAKWVAEERQEREKLKQTQLF